VEYLPIVLLAALAAVFAAGSFVASGLFAPKRPTAAKMAPYECGIVPRQEAPQRFPVRFFLIAMVFIIFDVEIVFLYPWAVDYSQLGNFGLVEVVAFAVIVFVAFSYLVANGGLNWGNLSDRDRHGDVGSAATQNQTSRPAEPVSGARTTAATVRRVRRSDGRVA
jgi:NADH-quinone oxidoreductase subunit A